jgi:hypothetical protein
VNRVTRLVPITAGLLSAALAFACTNEATGPDGPAFAQAGQTKTTATACSPQPYASSSGWIGPQGGRLKAGKHTLWVPTGALKAPTFITMEAPYGDINRVSFGPEGLSFDKRYPAQLVMSYQNCWVSPSAEQQIAYINESLHIVEMTASQTDPLTLTVKAKLSHFSDYVLMSTYAVAY